MSYLDVLVAAGASSVWKMNELSGTTAVDALGVQNGTWTSPTFNQQVLVPSSGDPSTFFTVASSSRNTIGNVYDFLGSTHFTVLHWMNVLSWNGSTGMLLWSNTDTPGPVKGWFMDLNAVFQIRAARGDNAGMDTCSYTTSAAQVVGKNTMISMIYDGTNIKIGVNGVNVQQLPSSKSVTAPTTNPNLTFGAFAGGGSGFSGYASYAAIFNGTDVSDGTLLNLYNSGLSLGLVSDTPRPPMGRGATW